MKKKAIIIITAIVFLIGCAFVFGSCADESTSDKKVEKTTDNGKSGNEKVEENAAKDEKSKDENKATSDNKDSKDKSSDNKSSSSSNSGNKSSSSNSGNKNNSSGGSSGGGSSSTPAHTHSFQPVYTTVTKYRTEQRQTGTGTVCFSCGRNFPNGGASDHILDTGHAGYGTQPTYETVQVPYTEQVLSHYKCSCGQTR